jgi:thymidylate synthase (FAD)
MKVELVSITQPAPRLQKLGIRTAQELIVHNARASSPQNQFNTATGPRLLRYCMDHGHWSVFEQASMGVEIVTSRAISAQILRHRSFHFQEFSQRYADVPALEPVQLRRQAEKNRQSSSELIQDHGLVCEVHDFNQDSLKMYQHLIASGVARECARMVLPMCAQTKVYMTGTARDWIHYLRLRMEPGTQKEHQDIAFEISCIFRDNFPDIAEAILLENTARQLT